MDRATRGVAGGVWVGDTRSPCETSAAGDRADRGTALLVEDFADESPRWEGDGGGIEGGAYRIDLPTDDDSLAYPAGATDVYPQAPENVQVEVDARSLDPPGPRSGFGVICRLDVAGRTGYPFTLRDGSVHIDKIGGGFERLGSASIPDLDMTSVRLNHQWHR